MATMGVSLNQFYCCGKLKSLTISLTDYTTRKCNKSGCCENKYHYVKVKDNHITAGEVSSPAKSFINLHLFTPSFKIIAIDHQLLTVANRSNAPPLYPHVPFYIYNRVFRI